jgi:hypothetical protein
MRKSILLIVLTFCILFPASLRAQLGEVLDVGVNRLHNGDFEDDPLDPWQLVVRSDLGAAAEWEIDKQTAASGKRSIMVRVTVSTGTDWHVKLRQDDRCFEPGEKFTVAFWCMAEDPRSLSVSFQLQRDPWDVFFNQTIQVDTEWTEYSVTFTPLVENFQDHWLAFQVGNTDTLVWFDDVRYFLGELDEEVGREPVQRAVYPEAKLTTTWAKVRSGH